MESTLEALRLEVSDYLEKPLSLAAVKEAIAMGLKRREEMHKTIENKVHQHLLSDSLTGLADRSLFMDRLNDAIAGIDRTEDRAFAVFLIDINNFKGINDSYGHGIGDRVLAELSNRLKSCVCETDTIARTDGDEFSVLIEKFESDEKVIAIAEHCQQTAEKDMYIDGIKIKLRVNIGIVLKTIFYQSPDDVLRDAGLALSRCKEQNGALIKVFDKNMLEQAVESLQLENDLRRAIQNNEFVLHYQPIVRLDDNRIIGLEALIRWSHPELGLIYPDEFIPKAEEIGLINQIGNWVLSEGCRQIKEWQATLPGFDDINLSINISGQQFLQPQYANIVVDVIQDHALDPAKLKFELTESVLIKNTVSSIKTLLALKDIGIKLALDDFGTGYSSFSYLQQFPLDDLKIDMSFIQQLEAGSETYEIVKSVVGLARKLGLKVVAEGVETEAQLHQVQRLEFDMVQGFWIAKPADAAAVKEFILNNL
jgi:diguanylate cyclase (GGDEF)-like protein